MEETLILGQDPRRHGLNWSPEREPSHLQDEGNTGGLPTHNFETSLWFQVVASEKYFFSDEPNLHRVEGCPVVNQYRPPADRTISQPRHLDSSSNSRGEK